MNSLFHEVLALRIWPVFLFQIPDELISIQWVDEDKAFNIGYVPRHKASHFSVKYFSTNCKLFSEMEITYTEN